MQILIKPVDDVLVVYFQGRLDHMTSPNAQEKLAELIGQGGLKLVVNFKELEYISSAGLRVLLSTAKQLGPIGGKISICCLNDIVQEVFDISGFVTIFSIFANEAEALDGFKLTTAKL
jgi:anti-anti-sigma factor